MGKSTLTASMKSVLFFMCLLAIASTFSQCLILYFLYLHHDSSLFYVHLSVSLLSPFLVFIYLLYGVRVSGDKTNPLLPFIIMWCDLKSHFNSEFELGQNLFYSFLNTYHSGCCTVISSVTTLLFVIPIIALCSPFMILFILISWSFYVSCTKSDASYDCNLLLLQFPFMIPCFYMYSAMLFILPIQMDSNIVLLMILFWISSVLYLSLFVARFSIEKRLSDLVLLSELLLLFSVLYIALLIDYDSYHYQYLHVLALIMLISSAITDGCFLKAAPVRHYLQLSNKFKSELYSFKTKDCIDMDSMVDIDKLYCLIHDIIYHCDPLDNEHVVIRLQNKGYEHVQHVKEPHIIDSGECYELQHKFIQKDIFKKKQHIHDLLDNNIFVMHKRSKVSKFKTFALMFVYLYWLLSIVVATYPFVWLFYAVFITSPQLMDKPHYRDMFVVFVIILYGVIMVHTCSEFYAHYDKFVLIRKLEKIPHVPDSDQKRGLQDMYEKMLVVTNLIHCIEAEAACIVLVYLYGETEKAEVQRKEAHSEDEADSLVEEQYDPYAIGGYDMQHLL